MFDKEFYPTPLPVLDLMGIDAFNKVVLEPSAGKGDIVDYLKNNGAKSVLAFEKNKDLAKIVGTKAEVLGNDFFECTAEQISHVQVIVMNPPFSNADKHINHAYHIAPEGCEIIALCNAETGNKYSRYRELASLVKNYGTFENLGSCFDTAERKTNVEIGLVKLFKPMVSESSDFEGFFFDADEEIGGYEGVMQHDDVFALVQRHVGALKAFDKLALIKDELEYSLKPLGVGEITLNVGYKESIATKEQFSKAIQKKSWKYIFDKMNLNRFVTSGVMNDINKFVEQQQKYPFTRKNIYRMFEIIVGTKQHTMNKALEEVIDNFTKHTKENRFGVEGWKTNSGYMLNKKFIINHMVEPSFSDAKVLHVIYGSKRDSINDLVKVICNITGKNYNKMTGIYAFSRNQEQGGLLRGSWYEWDLFKIKVFKKGTMHLEFKDINDWYMLNKAYGELKGFTLSSNYK